MEILSQKISPGESWKGKTIKVTGILQNKAFI